MFGPIIRLKTVSKNSRLVVATVPAIFALVFAAQQMALGAAAQSKTFATPEEAVRAIMAAVLTWLDGDLETWIHAGTAQRVLWLGGLVLAGATVYFASLWLCGLRSANAMLCRMSTSRAITSRPTPPTREAVPVKYSSMTSWRRPTASNTCAP